jgi:glutamyl-tRNA synthetase
MSVRVRFAPSPTGYLHIGGARTALFNWLYARHTGGKFILRVEDTDEARNSQEAVDVIIESLKWLGLDWDEGPVDGSDFSKSKGDCGPYFQSQRKEIYQKYIQQLLDADKAYEHEGAIKFRMRRETIIIDDLVVGRVDRKLTDREEADPDFVIVRSDGKPVFHLVNVIDDLEMGMTHVIRGEDHLSNTSKHIELFRALEAEPPKYAHIPLILNKDGSKMSKRDLGASVTTYIDGGFVPSAVVNYLLLLGWSPKDDQEIFALNEVVERFDLPQINRQNARFDFDKLKWFNYEHTRALSPEAFRSQATQALEKAGIDISTFDNVYLDAAFDTCKEKIKQFTELPEFCDFYFKDVTSYDEEHAAKHLIPENQPCVARLREMLAGLDPFDADSIQAGFKALAGELEVKVGVLVHPIRLACTGRKVGPSLFHLMEVLGKEKVLERTDVILKRLGSG